MAKKTLRMANSYTESYEGARDIISRNPLFNQEDWSNVVSGNSDIDVNTYLGIMNKANEWDSSKIKNEYNFDFADSKTRIAALSNEFNKDYNTGEDRVRTIEVPEYDESGKVVVKDGTISTTKKTISEYDYYKMQIKAYNDEKYQEYLRNEAEERKKSSGFLEAYVAPIGAELLTGVTGQLDDITSLFYGLSAGTFESIATGKDWADTVVSKISSDDARLFAGIEEDIIEWEKNYTQMRDVDGNFTNYGKYAGSISNSIGMMIPSMAVSAIPGIGKVASQATFYLGMTGGNIKDMYDTALSNGYTISTGEILANASVKSVMQLGMEHVVAKLVGGSAMDSIMFGRTNVATVTGKTLGARAGKRLAHDFISEGLEEVFQDTSDAFVDLAFSRMSKDFSKFVNISPTTLIDSFVIGGITSVIATSPYILLTSSKKASNLAGTKFDKLSAWEYNMELDDFVRNYKDVKEYIVEHDSETELKSNGQKALSAMYASYRMIGSIYAEIGTERFEQAEAFLAELKEELQDVGKYGLYADYLYNDVFSEMPALSAENAKKALENAEVKADDESKIIDKDNIDEADDEVNSVIKKLLDTPTKSGKERKVLTVDKAKKPVQIETKESEVLVVPKDMLNSVSTPAIIGSVQSDIFVEDVVNIVKNTKLTSFKAGMNELYEYHKLYNPDDDLDVFVMKLLFDGGKTFSTCMSISTKDSYNFLYEVIAYTTKITSSTASLDENLRRKLSKDAVKTMHAAAYQFVLQHPYAKHDNRVFTSSELSKISEIDRTAEVFKKILSNQKLSKDENDRLNKIIENTMANEENRNAVKTLLASPTYNNHTKAINLLKEQRNKTFESFYSLYDGKTYPKENTYPNIILGKFLQSKELTLRTLYDTTVLSKEEGALISSSEYTTIAELRDAQFRSYTGNTFSLVKTKDVYVPYEIKQTRGTKFTKDVIKGYDVYSPVAEALSEQEDTAIAEATKGKLPSTYTGVNKFVAELMDSSLDKGTIEMASIDDLVNQPDLLSEAVRTAISKQYKSGINQVTAFLYLRDYIVRQTDGQVGVTRFKDGTYGLVDLKPFTSRINKSFDIPSTGMTALSKLKGIDISLLKGDLKDVKVGYWSDSDVKKRNITSAGAYNPFSNEIRLHPDLKNNITLRNFVFTHELQHAIQTMNGMNTGFSVGRLKAGSPLAKNLVQSVEKHLGKDIFTPNASDEAKLEIVERFLYDNSAEIQSNGYEFSEYNQRYSVFVTLDNTTFTVTLPWGESFSYDINNVSNDFVLDTSSVINKAYEQALVNRTSELTMDNFKTNPRSCFIMPDGSLRTFSDSDNHYEMLAELSGDYRNKTAVEYYSKLPQISVNWDYIAVRISTRGSKEIDDRTMEVLDFLYSRGKEFSLGFSSDTDYMQSVQVSSDEADNSDDLVKILKRVAASSQSDNLGYAMEFAYWKKTIQESLTAHERLTNMSDGERTRVTVELARDNNLQYFKDRFDKSARPNNNYMRKDLATFVINSTGKEAELPKFMVKKIKAGTLTRKDILYHLYSSDLDKMNETTFDLINDSFFHNKAIDSASKLKSLIYDSVDYWTIVRMLKDGSFGVDEQTKDTLLNYVGVDSLYSLVDVASRKDSLSRKYNSIRKSFDENLKSEINYDNLRRLFMITYDGSMNSAYRAANMGRIVAKMGWNTSTGDGKTSSLDANVGDDTTLANFVEDKSALEEFNSFIDSLDESQKQDFISDNVDEISQEAVKRIMSIYGVSKKSFVYGQRAKAWIESLNEDQLNSLTMASVLAHVKGVKLDAALDVAKTVETSVEKNAQSYRQSASSTTAYIQRMLSGGTKAQENRKFKLFMQDHGDLFDIDNKNRLTLKEDATKVKDVKGRLVLRSTEELRALTEKLKGIKEEVKSSGKYDSEAAYKTYKQAQETLKKAEREFEKAKKYAKGSEKVKTVEVIVKGAPIVLSEDTGTKRPEILNKLLDFSFDNFARSRTQFLTEDNEVHVKFTLDQFLSANSEIINTLTATDANEIAEYFANSVPLDQLMDADTSNKYNNTMICLSTYLLKQSENGILPLSDETYHKLNNRLESIIRQSATSLSVWRIAKDHLRPTQVVMNALAKRAKLQVREEDVAAVANAIEHQDAEALVKAKKKMYENAALDYKKVGGTRDSFFNKLIQFERMAMLSSPGTWIRNGLSNVVIAGFDVKFGNKTYHVKGLNENSESLGAFVVKLLPKSTAKNERLLEGYRSDGNIAGYQYKIIGTKVSEQVSTFVKNTFLDSGILQEAADGISRYSSTYYDGPTETLAEIIGYNIKTKLFYDTDAPGKLGKAYDFIIKQISDDKFVTRQTIKYMGKMLQEDLDNGIIKKLEMNKEVMNVVADAYLQAAQDFMHKPNFFNKLESGIRTQYGDAVYFAYKQFLPFAASSWNWYTEGLWYNPVGFAKAILDYAKLETTIERIEERRAKHEHIPSSRFAQYVATRNLGKGLIGSIGFGIGAIAALMGWASIDEDDDKYKLRVGDVYVDISDLFGTQGIFLGMTGIGYVMDNLNGDDVDIMDVIAKTLDTMAQDSVVDDVYRTFRYSSSIGDVVLNQFSNSLSMAIPNFLKTMSSVVNPYKIKYPSGITGKIEKLFVQTVPFGYEAPFVNKYIDIYSGEEQIPSNAWLLTNVINHLSPIDVVSYRMNDLEKEAIYMGVRKGNLKGNYTVNGSDVNLPMSEITKLNVKYGELNKLALTKLFNDQSKVKVKNEKNEYVTLFYSKMTDKQKVAAIEQIMSHNSDLAKVYILTSNGYKYYATDYMYSELRKNGISTNVYKASGTRKDFVK